MKKTVRYIFFILLLSVFTGCVKEKVMPENPLSEDGLVFPEGEKALIHMSVSIPGVLEPETKAMSDIPQGINDLHVVVFGSSGFLKESVEAENVQSAHTNGNATLYTFDVKLSLTDSKNLRIHVIGNLGSTKLPYKYEDVVMTGSAFTTGTADAYWCRFLLPDGITPMKVYNTETQAMEYVKDGNGYFKVADEITQKFTALPLIRNFAKITVESTTPQLVLDPTETIRLINIPDKGSVAPFYADSARFIQNYKDLSYSEMKLEYPGCTPAETHFTNTEPNTAPYYPCGKNSLGQVTGGAFMYERPKPVNSNDTPSYAIICGTYYPLKAGKTKEDLANATDPDTVLDKNNPTRGYYKIDFMDEDGYYAVYRNFRYHIRITGVSKPGAATPADAGSTGGSGDISSSNESAGLTDISDGYGRIAVSFVEMTIVEQKAEVVLSYKFIPDVDVTGDTPSNELVSEGGPITITLNGSGVIATDLSSEITNGSSTGTEIDGGTSGKIMVLDGNDDRGFRTIKFTTKDSGDDRQEQTIRISGSIASHNSTLYRDVKFILMKKQTMTVECKANEPDGFHALNAVEDVTGQGVDVYVTIPNLLPESMFPLLFNMESSALSITPNTTKYPLENLPVSGGTSLANPSTQAFHYVKTLSYADYSDLATVDGKKTFVCHFKTNKANSGSTVYVTNDYFNPANGAFINYSMFDFSNLAFSNTRAAANTALNFSFSRDSGDTGSRTFVVTLDGLVPQTPNANGWAPLEGDQYSFTTSSANPTLALKTITRAQGYDWTYGITLEALNGNVPVYHPASLDVAFEPVPSTGITLNPTNTTVGVGETVQLNATLTPNDSTDGIAWTSSDTSIATVNAQGIVTGVAAGTATITATTDSGRTATCSVRVRRKVWHAASYTINLRTSTSNSFTTAPQNVVLSNVETGGNNNNRYRAMGTRERYYNFDIWQYDYRYNNGTYVVTAPTGANYIDARIIGLANTYSNNISTNTNAVTYTSGSTTLGNDKASWGTTNTSSTSEVSGYNSVTVSYACNGSWDSRHRLTQIVVYYGYFTYEN